MKLFFFLVSLVVCSAATFGQKISVQGLLKDSTNAPLPSATVILLNEKDSSLVNFTSTNHEGFFELKNVARQKHLLKITYVGYQTFTRLIEPLNDQSVINIGEIAMRQYSKELDEITIVGEKAPVTIKKDTIEFNAGSFKTKENAVVEDLLKKLPGVEVDNDGTIRAQGEQVRRVTVDGKNFFGNDPKIATRNLPADAISKVQVFDKKSDQAAFTGIDDGQREKTINLELKEEKRKGAFGNVMGGLGSEERYQAKANINRFQRERQFSLLAMANNVNEQGFGIEEYMNFTGGSQQMASGRGSVRLEFNGDNQNGVPLNFGNRNNGLMNSYAGGVNINNQFNKKTELNGSYFYNHLDHDTRTLLERINYLPLGATNQYNQNSTQSNANENHRISTTLEHKLDSMNSLKLTTTGSFTQTEMNDVSTSNLMNDGGEVLNSADRFNSSQGSSAGLNSNLLWRHRFNKKGRTLSANLQFSFNESQRDGSQNSRITGKDGIETQVRQWSEQRINNLTYGSTLTYTEPLGQRKYLEANYAFRENLNDFSRLVYDVSSNETLPIPSLSSEYNSAYQYHRGGINFKINRKKYNVTVGTSWQKTFLEGTLITQGVDIKKSFENVLPVARFNFDFTNTRRISIDYETNVQEPSIQQLQPVVDNSDPLNLYVGNADLRPAYVQTLRTNFVAFNPVSFINFFAFLEGSITQNAISMSQTFSDSGVRLTRPVNVKENKRLNGNASFGFPLTRIKSRFNITANVMHQSGITVINDIDNQTIQNTLGGRFRYEFRYNDIFDIAAGANISRQTAIFESGEQLDQLYFNNSFTGEANLTFLKNYTLSSAFEYLSFENKTMNFLQAIPLWNISLSRYILKAKSGEIKFSVNNVLDRSISVSQMANANYFETQQTNNLGRYLMVSFLYSINKQLNPMGAGRPRGGMIRIMR